MKGGNQARALTLTPSVPFVKLVEKAATFGPGSTTSRSRMSGVQLPSQIPPSSRRRGQATANIRRTRRSSTTRCAGVSGVVATRTVRVDTISLQSMLEIRKAIQAAGLQQVQTPVTCACVSSRVETNNDERN